MESIIMQQLKSELTQAIPTALSQFDQMPNSAFIRLPVVMSLYGVSAATIWRGVKNLTIPKPVKLTERCTAWNVGLIRESLAAKAVA
jgi:predicted DNA-binding transcriptional regulator AlpA